MSWAPGRPTAAMLARITLADAGSDSTSTTRVAPRDSASRPMAPDPAYRSSTPAPVSGPCIAVTVANTPSRARSLVGRVLVPPGTASRRPLAAPAMIRVTPPRTRASRLLQEAGLFLVQEGAHLGGQRRVARQVPVGIHEAGGLLAGRHDQVPVVQHAEQD